MRRCCLQNISANSGANNNYWFFLQPVELTAILINDTPDGDQAQTHWLNNRLRVISLEELGPILTSTTPPTGWCLLKKKKNVNAAKKPSDVSAFCCLSVIWQLPIDVPLSFCMKKTKPHNWSYVFYYTVICIASHHALRQGGKDRQCCRPVIRPFKPCRPIRRCNWLCQKILSGSFILPPRIAGVSFPNRILA